MPETQYQNWTHKIEQSLLTSREKRPPDHEADYLEGIVAFAEVCVRMYLSMD